MPERNLHHGNERGATPRLPRDSAAARHSAPANGGALAPPAPAAPELDRRHVGLSLGIRECLPDDAAKLEWMGLMPAQRASLDDAYARHARGDEVLLVAESQGFPVALLRITLPAEAGEAASIAALRVMPGLQGLGLGTALMAAAERVARQRGRAALEISIDDDDEKGRARNVRLGYAAVARNDGRTLLRKTLDLAAARPLQPSAR
jgi:GNAT superfamily N-acetyltransferase